MFATTAADSQRGTICSDESNVFAGAGEGCVREGIWQVQSSCRGGVVSNGEVRSGGGRAGVSAQLAP